MMIPASATIPRNDRIETGMPMMKWPTTAPITPNGISPITNSACTYDFSRNIRMVNITTKARVMVYVIDPTIFCTSSC